MVFGMELVNPLISSSTRCHLPIPKEAPHSLMSLSPRVCQSRTRTLLNLGDTTVTLLPEEGTLIQLETPVFLHLVDTHAIQVRDTSQSAAMALSVEAHRLLTQAGPEALDV